MRLSPDELDVVVDAVQYKDQVARLPAPPVPHPDSWSGQQAAAAERARQQRRDAFEAEKHRQEAEALAAADAVQADADEARAQLGRLARKIQRRAAERQRAEREGHELIARGRALISRDQQHHADFDQLVTQLVARAAAVPPRKENG